MDEVIALAESGKFRIVSVIVIFDMASLRRHPSSRFFIACFTDASGKQRQRSTKLTDRAKALLVAQSWEQSYRRQITDLQLREVYSQISAEVTGQRLDFDTADQFFRRWLENRKIERKHSSFQKYEAVVVRFLAAIGTKADKDLMLVSSADVTNYRNSLAQRLKPSTVNGHLKILRVAFEDAVREGRIAVNPAKQVRTIQRGTASARRPFTTDEINRLLRAANTEWRGLILAGVCTGQRLGDITRLRWSNIDSEKRVLTITTRKTGRRVSMWICDPFWDYLSEIEAPDATDAPIFPRAFAAVEEADSVHPLSKEFHSLLVSVGLAKEWDSKKTGTGRSVARDNTGLSFHALRHSATSFLKRAGVPEAVAMAVIGHSSRAVSDNYTHMDEATIAAWMQSANKTAFAGIG
jgi:integrase